MYYAVKHDTDDEPMVIAQFVDEGDARDEFAGAKRGVEVFSTDEMRADATLAMELARWEGDRAELERRFLLREWYESRDSFDFSNDVCNLRGHLQYYARPAALLVEDDPTIALAIAVYDALVPLEAALSAIEKRREAVAVEVGASS